MITRYLTGETGVRTEGGGSVTKEAAVFLDR